MFSPPTVVLFTIDTVFAVPKKTTGDLIANLHHAGQNAGRLKCFNGLLGVVINLLLEAASPAAGVAGFH